MKRKDVIEFCDAGNKKTADKLPQLERFRTFTREV